MHAIHTRVTVNDREAGEKTLQDEIVPRVSAAPGFVAGYWVDLPGGKGTSIMVFDSEESAQAVAGRIGQLSSQPNQGVSIDSVEVGEVVAHA
jgi:hypothetical protein